MAKVLIRMSKPLENKNTILVNMQQIVKPEFKSLNGEVRFYILLLSKQSHDHYGPNNVSFQPKSLINQ